jgi:hypothetical protein
MDETTPQAEINEVQKSGSLGPIMATIIIVLVCLVGGIYFIIKQQQHAKALQLQNEQLQLPANS